ncbi:LuxR C-terminal-related transcriptional regulator [Shewanella mangrovi]|uniref:LuxR C-terminal-related transcriptional regulator n=1 Tax=Shewanella mangrovi TaxID=1515746 RepID=UPI003D34FBE7
MATGRVALTPHLALRSSSNCWHALAACHSGKDKSWHCFDGSTNKQMSESFCLSLRTIEVHRANAMRKLGVHTMAE